MLRETLVPPRPETVHLDAREVRCHIHERHLLPPSEEWPTARLRKINQGSAMGVEMVASGWFYTGCNEWRQHKLSILASNPLCPWLQP